MSPERTVEAARDTRARLIHHHPFFGMPSMRLRLHGRNYVPTACTDGKHLYINPDWFAALNRDERMGLLAHETAHCMLLHPIRRGARDATLWNVACDHVINRMLQANGFTLPAGGVMLTDVPADATAEQVYDLLDSRLPDDHSLRTEGPGGIGMDVEDPTDGDPDCQEAQVQESEWKSAVKQAAQIAEKAGRMPLNVDQVIQLAETRRIDWRSATIEFLAMTVPVRRSMMPPARRHLWRGMYMPTTVVERNPEILVAVDTSGSVDDALLQTFLGFVQQILGTLRCKVHLVTCDTRAVHVGDYEGGDALASVHVTNRGGTYFHPPFDLARERRWQLDGAIYFTDGEGTFPAEPEFPTLWIISTSIVSPIGRTLHIGE